MISISHQKTVIQQYIVEKVIFKSEEKIEELIFEETARIIPNIKSEPQTPNNYELYANKLERRFPISKVKLEEVKIEQEETVLKKPVIRLKKLEFYSTKKLNFNSRYNLRKTKMRESYYIFSPFTSYIFSPLKPNLNKKRKKIFKTIKVIHRFT